MVMVTACVQACFCLTGCATTGSAITGGKTAVSPREISCVDVAGTTLDNPVSGRGLSTLLGNELLMCPDGAIATLLTTETTISATDGIASDTEVLTIHCPDGNRVIYTSPRGGLSDCIPAPFAAMDPRAADLHMAAVAEMRFGNFKKALRMARKASKIQEDSEAVMITLGTAQMAGRDFQGAEKTFARALKIDPGNVTVRLAHAVCLSEIGEKAMYAAEIFRLYDEVPVSDPLHWDLTCRVADSFNRIGNRDEAIRLARVACEHGVSMCCDLARSDREAREIQ